MRHKKHIRKMNHVVIVTSDAVDANVKQFRIRPWMLQVIILILCIIIGALIGFFIYEEDIWEAANMRAQEQLIAMEELAGEKEALEAEKKELESQVSNLNDRIQILSETVNQKTQTETELAAELESQSVPTEFPLSGSASMTEETEGDPMCVFTASVGSTVVATAKGTVTAINDDAEYGHSLTIDHGNGYMTVYRNNGDATVSVGDSVVQGSALFVISEDNASLGYQMMKDGVYMNPMELLTING